LSIETADEAVGGMDCAELSAVEINRGCSGISGALGAGDEPEVIPEFSGMQFGSCCSSSLALGCSDISKK
jgi:hypothetical protein